MALGETALVLAAVLASQGKLQIWLVILIGVASAILGDNLGHLLGRHFGRDVLVAQGPLHDHRMKAVAYGDRFFERHGARAVFLARWIALVRFAAAWLAGINRMPFRVFFFWNALGGLSWGISYGLVGRPRGDREPGPTGRLLGLPLGTQPLDRLDVGPVQVRAALALELDQVMAVEHRYLDALGLV